MSYDIFYNKQFVQLRKTGEVIPMLLAGSNNCYEIGLGGRNGRRTRSWESDRYYNRKGKLSEKPDIILSKLDAELRKILRRHRGDKEAKPADIRKHFGYYSSMVVGSGHCGGTSFDQYRGVYANGIRNSMTVEQLDQLGVNLVFHAGYNSEDGYPASVPLKTEREYFAELKKWREWQGQNGRYFYLTFNPSSTDRVLERLRASRRRTPREKTRVEQDHYFVLTDGYNNLVKYTSRGYRYSYSKSGGKQYRTEELAEKFRQMLVDKGRHQAESWKVERVDQACSFLV